MDTLKLECLVLDNATVVAVNEQVCADLAGESVILNLKSGVYYGLNEVGAKIWQLIQQPKTVTEIREALLQDYDVEPEDCQRDLLILLQELAAVKLIEVKHEAAP